MRRTTRGRAGADTGRYPLPQRRPEASGQSNASWVAGNQAAGPRLLGPGSCLASRALLNATTWQLREAASLSDIDREKTVLITGGAGFIGSHLADLLLS